MKIKYTLTTSGEGGRVSRAPRLGPVSALEEARRMAGLSVVEFASSVGVSPSLVAQIELGRLHPSQRFKAGACRVLAEHLPEILFPQTEGQINGS